MSDDKKNPVPAQLAPHVFPKGVSGNPGGRTPKASQRGKMITRLNRIWGQATAPADWFHGLEHLIGTGLTIDEVIAIRAKYCLANNVKYQNSALLKDMIDRYEGKVPLYVGKQSERPEDDFDELSDDELTNYIASLDARALDAAEQKKLEAPKEEVPQELNVAAENNKV